MTITDAAATTYLLGVFIVSSPLNRSEFRQTIEFGELRRPGSRVISGSSFSPYLKVRKTEADWLTPGYIFSALPGIVVRPRRSKPALGRSSGRNSLTFGARRDSVCAQGESCR